MGWYGIYGVAGLLGINIGWCLATICMHALDRRRIGPFSWGSSYFYGSWWFRVGRVLIAVKAPWAHVFFSEREGLKPFFPRHGWRIRIEWSEHV
jgi:hypothetical protein